MNSIFGGGSEQVMQIEREEEQIVDTPRGPESKTKREVVATIQNDGSVKGDGVKSAEVKQLIQSEIGENPSEDEVRELCSQFAKFFRLHNTAFRTVRVT